ncbi:hypothetical protein BN1088_1300001 [Sphingobacterium sp. PM2-P1-29]|nr:hypothetical protein BN1088_1300001 [Sphingobacterium sp. PM2-P1-29]
MLILAVTSAAAIATIFFILDRNILVTDENESFETVNTDSPVLREKFNGKLQGEGGAKEEQTSLIFNEQLAETFSSAQHPQAWQRTASIEVVNSKNRILSTGSLSEISIPTIKPMTRSKYRFHPSIEAFPSFTSESTMPLQNKNEYNAAPRDSRSVLSILAGPDLSNVRGSDQSTLSENVGVLYSYPVVSRLSISLGATYAKKNYRSDYSLYSPANPPTLTEMPSMVNAECDVIDIPLTANYTVLKNKKIKFNVSAGLSSYFMLKEKYTFEYGGSGNSENKRSAVYEISGENQHIFGVADFSISLEKKVSDKINVGIKPFLKMPLTGIGYGRVDLESKGIALMVGVTL